MSFQAAMASALATASSLPAAGTSGPDWPQTGQLIW
jgi:hypothetical protein